MNLRPNIEGWLPVICWGVALHTGWKLSELIWALAAWVFNHLAK